MSRHDLRRARLWSVVATVVLAAAMLTAASLAVSSAPSRRPLLSIERLTGAVVRISRSGYVPFGVRLRATVCFRSAAAALNSYPSAITIRHFLYTKSLRKWWTARTVVDHAPWLVPFGETWHGKRCGPVLLDDPIPSDHYGAESLG